MRHFHFDRRLVRYQKLSSLAELEALEFRYENTIYLVPKEEPAANGAPAENKYAEYIWMPNESDPTPPSEDRKGFVHEISARRVLNPFSVKGIVHGVKPIPVDRTKGHWELLGSGDGDSGDIEDLKRRMGIAEGSIASLEEFEGNLLGASVFGWGPRLDVAEASIGTIFTWGPSIFGNGPDSLEGRITDAEVRISSLSGSVANFGPRISFLETGLSAETGRATGEEERIEGKVDAETLRAKGAESDLADDIAELEGTVDGVRTDLGQPGDEAQADGSAFARIAYLSNIGLKHLKYEVWEEEELPEASSRPYTILLVKKQGGTDPKNIFTEYISIETASGWKWEKLGEAGLDLSNVVSKAELQAEAQARTQGDADTLDDAKDYTDGVKEDLETAIAAGDAATLDAAKGYTDTKFAEAAVSVVNANEAPETKVPTQEMVFSGGYVAMVTDPETKKVEFYIRENKDNPLMDGAAQVPANGSYFIYGPSSAIPFQLPEGKATGSPFDHCVNMDDIGALTLNVLPAKLRAAKKTDSITVKVYKGGDGEAAYSMEIPAAEVTTTGKTENHITVSAGEVVVVDPSRPDYKELINEGGLTPGSVQFTNLKARVAVSEIVANGGALRVVLTIGGAEHKFDTGNLFLYRTDRNKPVIPGGGFTATVKYSVDKYLSGVKYHGQGTVVTATLKDVENTCYYISPTETKATISASELKGGSSTARVQASDSPDVDYKLNHTADFTMGSGVVFTSTTEPKLTVSCSGQTVNATSGSATVSRKAGYSGFYSLVSSANTFMEDFLDETLRLKEASYSGDTSDIPWDSTSTEGLRVLGKAVGQGQLMYPSGGTGERNYLRRFKDPAADGENRISTFDITVGGLSDSYESDKVAIYCYDRKGTRFQLNRVVTGGMNVPAKPSGGKWRCAWPATADQPYTQKGIVVEVVMQSAAASKTISKITLAFNPKD